MPVCLNCTVSRLAALDSTQERSCGVMYNAAAGTEQHCVRHAAEAAVPVYLGAGRWMRLLQDSLFDEVLASRGVKVGGLDKWAGCQCQ